MLPLSAMSKRSFCLNASKSCPYSPQSMWKTRTALAALHFLFFRASKPLYFNVFLFPHVTGNQTAPKSFTLVFHMFSTYEQQFSTYFCNIFVIVIFSSGIPWGIALFASFHPVQQSQILHQPVRQRNCDPLMIRRCEQQFLLLRIAQKAALHQHRRDGAA